MKADKFLFPLLIALFIVACETTDLQTTSLYNAWEQTAYEQETLILKRVNTLSGNEYGFEFKENGIFVENKNSGWCGTPPISYAMYEGKWTAVSDSIFKIEVPYWGGEMNYILKIVSQKKDELRVLFEYNQINGNP